MKQKKFLCGLTLLCGMTQGAWADQVEYLDRWWDEATQSVKEELKTAEATQITAAMVKSSQWKNPHIELNTPGWYYISGTIETEIYEILLQASPSVHIILCDDAEIKASSFEMTSGELHFYGQAKGTGKFISDSTDGRITTRANTYSNYSINIHGGHFDYLPGSYLRISGPTNTTGTINIYGGVINTYSSTGPAIGNYNHNPDDPQKVGDGGTINIYGGKITAKVSIADAAGIGFAKYAKQGTINIKGGEIESRPYKNGAGIGGGDSGDGVIINISGGTIKAYGGSEAAGIGTSIDGDSPFINISGGNIYAEGGDQGAGIGTGNDGYGGTIKISGGTIEAHGGSLGAGIGCGNESNDVAFNLSGGNITISGGTIKAYGGSDAAGIGGGEDADGGNIVITGGDIYAEGKDYGTGIGVGQDANGNGDDLVVGRGGKTTISITGGRVEAKAGGSCGNYGSFGTYDRDDWDDKDGGFVSISIGPDMRLITFNDGVQENVDRPYELFAEHFKVRSHGIVQVCEHPLTNSYALTDADTHRVSSCIYCLLGGKDESHTFSADGQCTRCSLMALDNAADNTTRIGTHQGPQTVALRGRALYKDGSWNTLTLPFDVDLSGSPLDGAEARTLNSSSFDNTDGTLTLNFGEPVTTLQAGTPYMIKWGGFYDISTAAEWNQLCADVASGALATRDKCFRLNADISVTTSLGTVDHPFEGELDGCGHTLNVSIESQATAAPIPVAKNATIRNLHVTGTVSGGIHSSGLVGLTKPDGKLNIHSVWVSTNVSTTATHIGGIVGHSENNEVLMTDCRFDGKLTGAESHYIERENYGGAIIGWCNQESWTLHRVYDYSTFENIYWDCYCINNSDFWGGNSKSSLTVTRHEWWVMEGRHTKEDQNEVLDMMNSEAPGSWQLKDGLAVPVMSSNTTVESPLFTGVTFSSTTANVETDYIDFVGTYDAISYTEDTPSVLFLGDANTLYYPLSGAAIGACHAYFQLKGITAGSADAPARITRFNLNFDGDGTQGIKSIERKMEDKTDAWYSLDGRRLQGNPSRAGVYIYNGKKTVIK